jgi:hypothetical protein
MIIVLFVQVLQELNAILLIVVSLLAPHALILVHRLIGARAHIFPFILFLGPFNTTIVVFDPFFLLDTYSYELFECPLVIHGVVIHLEGFKFLRE